MNSKDSVKVPLTEIEKLKIDFIPEEDHRNYSNLYQLNSAKNEKTWMLSYMDLMSLLFILFVFLISVANFEEPGNGGGQGETNEVNARAFFPAPGSGTGYQSKVENIRSLLSDAELNDKVELTLTDKKIELVLSSKFLFPSASAEITAEGHAILKSILPILMSLDGEISIEGHTDNQPIDTQLYPSNWELSTARSSRVARLLIEQGIGERKLKVVGFAHTRPVSSNLYEVGREKNRRVMISVETP